MQRSLPRHVVDARSTELQQGRGRWWVPTKSATKRQTFIIEHSGQVIVGSSFTTIFMAMVVDKHMKRTLQTR